jgi:hypothetical protein
MEFGVECIGLAVRFLRESVLVWIRQICNGNLTNPHAHSLSVRIPTFSRRSGVAHIPTLADAVQDRAEQRDAAREALRDTVWAHIGL